MSDSFLLNPRPMVQNLVGKRVRVQLKWGGQSYVGTLVSSDSYMNFLLHNTTEYVNGKETGVLGRVLIRCNNVLYVGEVPDGQFEASQDVPVQPVAGEDAVMTG